MTVRVLPLFWRWRCTVANIIAITMMAFAGADSPGAQLAASLGTVGRRASAVGARRRRSVHTHTHSHSHVRLRALAALLSSSYHPPFPPNQPPSSPPHPIPALLLALVRASCWRSRMAAAAQRFASRALAATTSVGSAAARTSMAVACKAAAASRGTHAPAMQRRPQRTRSDVRSCARTSPLQPPR